MDIVIQTALQIRIKQFERERNIRSARFEKMQRRKHLKYLIEQSIYLGELIAYETFKAFDEYMERLHKAEREIQREMNGYEMY